MLDELRSAWPCEVVAPYGEVLIIPSKSFRREWDQQLKSEGHRTYMQGFNGETCVFVKVEKQAVTPIERRAKKRPWTSQDDSRLKELHGQDLTAREIGAELDRTKVAVLHRIKRLGLRSVEHSKSTATATLGPANMGDDVFKEFLSAVNVLFPSHRVVCSYLLRELASKIMETKT